MNTAIRPDRFKITIGRLTDGLYVLSEGINLGETLLPKIFIREFNFQSSITVSNASLSSNRFDAVFPDSSRSFLQEGDVVSVTNNVLRVILTRRSDSNTILVTEQCDNLCQFCSQPPKEQNDEALLGMAAHALIDFNLDGLVGITGGEPFLYKDKFIKFLNVLDTFSVKSSLHILTNGRAFSDLNFTSRFQEAVSKRNLTLGIPIYSTESALHDELVGADGAWRETINGLINLMHAGINIELRFIPTKLNISQLKYLIPFVARCFPSLAQVSIMNMEPKGWARKNWDRLFISPIEYKDTLSEVCVQSQLSGVSVVLFNYPLCHINESEYSFAAKSISDWKNSFAPDCEQCLLIASCGGYFSSAEGKFLDKPRKIL